MTAACQAIVPAWLVAIEHAAQPSCNQQNRDPVLERVVWHAQLAGPQPA